jgi:hypothetical protein
MLVGYIGRSEIRYIIGMLVSTRHACQLLNCLCAEKYRRTDSVTDDTPCVFHQGSTHNSDDVEHASGAINDESSTTGAARPNRETLFGVTEEEIELLEGTRYGELSFESYVNQVR